MNTSPKSNTKVALEKATKVLSLYMKSSKNRQLMSLVIYKHCIKYNVDPEILLYEITGYLEEKRSLRDIKRYITSKKYGMDNPMFDNIKVTIHNQDEFTENPFEVTEGISKCKCGCTKVFTFQVQSRSCDEPASTHNKCTRCGKTWVYSG